SMSSGFAGQSISSRLCRYRPIMLDRPSLAFSGHDCRKGSFATFVQIGEAILEAGREPSSTAADVGTLLLDVGGARLPDRRGSREPGFAGVGKVVEMRFDTSVDPPLSRLDIGTVRLDIRSACAEPNLRHCTGHREKEDCGAYRQSFQHLSDSMLGRYDARS